MKHGFLIFSLLLASTFSLSAENVVEKPAKWDLKTCIEYARKNNIQVQKARITTQENEITLKQSKESLFPSVSASNSFNFSNGKIQTDGVEAKNNATLGSNYSLNTSMTLFNGLKNYNTIKQNELSKKASDLTSKVTENSIEISITEAYLEILYAHETLEMAKRTVETSKAQVALSQNLLNAGKIAKADFSQVQAQYSSDLYAVVTDQNNYDTQKLTLKQLLELNMTDELEIFFPDFKEADVLTPLPSKADVYKTALNVMPQIQNSELSVQISEYDLKIAKSSYYPTLSLSGSLSTKNYMNISTSFGDQLNNNFYQSLGLSLSIPIYSNGSTRASVQKARLGIQSAKLDYTSVQKDLLKTVESLYQDAVSMQSKYYAAKENLKYTEESYNLTEGQFKLGMKNTVELLTAKDKYLEAEQTLLQAKYGAVLSQKLLNFYQNIPIEL
jgi:outer membrane protein